MHANNMKCGTRVTTSSLLGICPSPKTWDKNMSMKNFRLELFRNILYIQTLTIWIFRDLGFLKKGILEIIGCWMADAKP
jgi:hypothetical protein